MEPQKSDGPRYGGFLGDGSLPDYELERFADVVINDETAVLVKAGLNFNEEGFLLPLGEHPWHKDCTQSYCILVTLPDKRRMVVPCAELIRFYFGSTSALIIQLFLPNLRRDKSCVSDRTDMEGRRRITLASFARLPPVDRCSPANPLHERTMMACSPTWDSISVRRPS